MGIIDFELFGFKAPTYREPLPKPDDTAPPPRASRAVPAGDSDPESLDYKSIIDFELFGFKEPAHELILVPPKPRKPQPRSRSRMPTLIVTLKLPPRALARAISNHPSQHLLHTQQSDKPLGSSPLPPSSPPTIASSPAPAAAGIVKKRGGPGKRARPAAPGSGVFALNAETGGASGAGTPAPQPEKEKAKPGPKANPGGINAGLRALDRSGKPTRRWQKVPVPVRTISGYTFYSTGWSAPGQSTSSLQVMLRLTRLRSVDGGT